MGCLLILIEVCARILLHKHLHRVKFAFKLMILKHIVHTLTKSDILTSDGGNHETLAMVSVGSGNHNVPLW